MYKHKQQLSNYLKSFIKDYSKKFKNKVLDEDFWEHYCKYLTSGKMFRGTLFINLYQTLSTNYEEELAIKIAAALELMQAGLLIQDDVMDGDSKRRGHDTIHSYLNQKNNYQKNSGNYIATCIGNISFELARSIFLKIDDSELVTKLIKISQQEFEIVNLGQVLDLHVSDSNIDIISEDMILDMYRQKTAHYTWIWPMILAAVVADREKIIPDLEKLGVVSGTVYQIIDDKLGLFGDTNDTGKSVRTDIIQGKKTLYWFYCYHSLDDKQKIKFGRLYGNPKLSDQDIEKMKKLFKSSGAVERVGELLEKLYQEEENLLSKIEMNDQSKKVIKSYIDFSRVRSS